MKFRKKANWLKHLSSSPDPSLTWHRHRSTTPGISPHPTFADLPHLDNNLAFFLFCTRVFKTHSAWSLSSSQPCFIPRRHFSRPWKILISYFAILNFLGVFGHNDNPTSPSSFGQNINHTSPFLSSESCFTLHWPWAASSICSQSGLSGFCQDALTSWASKSIL